MTKSPTSCGRCAVGFELGPPLSGELKKSLMKDVMTDQDVRRHCLSIANSNGLPVPGLVIAFNTTITDGYNFFGQALAGGDSTFSTSSFSTYSYSGN